MQEGFLLLEDFIDITGLLLDGPNQVAMFNRANARATKLLERVLGWRINYRENYFEVAKMKQPLTCPDEKLLQQWLDDPISNPYFVDPDETQGGLKLFPFNPEDANLLIDPASSVYAVKLVKTISGQEKRFVTVFTYDPKDWQAKTDISIDDGFNPLIRWLEICKTPSQLPCNCNNYRNCFLLAVDADYPRTIGEDLKYVLAEIILYYMKTQPTLEQLTDYPVSSESVDGHSVSYSTNVKPEDIYTAVIDKHKDTLLRYIGPYSPYYKGVKVL